MALQAAGQCLPRRSRTSGAKAGSENEPVIGAVNRCAPKIAAPPKIKVHIDSFRRLFSRAIAHCGDSRCVRP